MNLTRLQNSKLSLGALIGALLLATIVFAEPAAIADPCIEQQAGKSLACSANDVRVTFADNIRNTFGAPMAQCTRGHTFSFIADFHVRTTAASRYDVGLYFATDGDPNRDGALSGTCSMNMIRDRHIDPAFPHAVVLGATVSADLDGDACRDISAAYGWRHIEGKVVTLRVDDVLCRDSDGDGQLNLPTCTSWSQNSGGVCSSPENTIPSSSSNCGCDNTFNVPLLVTPESIQVVEDAPTVSLAERRPDAVLLTESSAPQDSHP